MDRVGPRRAVRVFMAEWRDRKGFTQEQLAERMETTKGTVSKLEKDKLKRTDQWMAAYAHALGIEPEDLFHHPDKPTANELLRGLPPEVQEVAIRMLRSLAGGG